MEYLLEGVKVLDVASYVAGPAAATVMADFGADVIKVEPPSGDNYRSLVAAYRTNYYWSLTSRNKRDIAIDLRGKEGQAVLHKLVEGADVILVNFNASQLAKYNLEYETLKQINPRLIFAHITGYGTKGPDSGRRAYDVAAWWSRSGILDLMQPREQRPPNAVGGVGDHASAMSLFSVIMMALFHRERSGAGSYVATSLAANGVWSNGMHLQAAIAGYNLADVMKEHGYRSHFMMPYCTRDGRYVQLVGADPVREWPLLCKALKHPEWLEDERFQDMVGIMECREELRQRFAEGFAKMNLVDVISALEAVDATFSVVETISDVLEDAHLIENEAIVKVESDNPDYQWTIGNPIEVGGFSKKPPKDGPEIGEHTRDILVEGGFSEEEILNLEQAGVVKQHS